MNKNISITGLILILLGAYFILGNFIDLDFLGQYVQWSYIWPLILIIIGVKMVIKK